MTQAELDVLVDLAAVDFLLSPSGQADLLEHLGAQDRSKLLDQAGTRRKMLESRRAISWATSSRLSICPEPVGHSTL